MTGKNCLIVFYFVMPFIKDYRVTQIVYPNFTQKSTLIFDKKFY